MTDTTHHSSIDIHKADRQAVTAYLDRTLATALDLAAQLKVAHWNLRGPHFLSRHELFDELASHTRRHADDVAERIATLGFYACGNLANAAQRSALPPYDDRALSGSDHVRALVNRSATWCSTVREAIAACGRHGDPASAALLSDILVEAEKDLWMLESHLPPPLRERAVALPPPVPLDGAAIRSLPQVEHCA